MAASSPSRRDVVSAYRSLYKAALHACRYTFPARLIVRDRIRAAFRDERQAGSAFSYPSSVRPVATPSSSSPASSSSSSTLPSRFDAQKIQNTLLFLRRAAASKGPEHKIFKNLCIMNAYRNERASFIKKASKEEQYKAAQSSVEAYNWSLKMLNERLGTSL